MILCDHCDEPAQSIFLLPDVISVQCIEGSCRGHDSQEGYELPLAAPDGMAKRPIHWLWHISEKVNSEATILTILTWLTFDGADAIDQLVERG